MNNIIILFLSTIILVSCAELFQVPSYNRTKSYSVTYKTIPSGARIVCSGSDYGYSPKNLYYTIDQESLERGYFTTTKCKAIWSTGYSFEFDNVIDLNSFPHGLIRTATRGNEDGNYYLDARFELELQRLNNEERRLKTSEEQAENFSRYLNRLQ